MLSPPLFLSLLLSSLILFPFFSVAKDWIQDLLHGGQALNHTLNILWTLLVASIEEDLETLTPDPTTKKSDRERGAESTGSSYQPGGRMTFPRGHEDFGDDDDDDDEHRWKNFTWWQPRLILSDQESVSRPYSYQDKKDIQYFLYSHLRKRTLSNDILWKEQSMAILAMWA